MVFFLEETSMTEEEASKLKIDDYILINNIFVRIIEIDKLGSTIILKVTRFIDLSTDLHRISLI